MIGQCGVKSARCTDRDAKGFWAGLALLERRGQVLLVMVAEVAAAVETGDDRRGRTMLVLVVELRAVLRPERARGALPHTQARAVVGVHVAVEAPAWAPIRMYGGHNPYSIHAARSHCQLYDLWGLRGLWGFVHVPRSAISDPSETAVTEFVTSF